MSRSRSSSIRPTTRRSLAELDANAGATSIDTRSRLAAKAFAHTAQVRHHGVELPAARARQCRRDLSRHAAAGLRKDPGPALRRKPAPARGVLSRARRRGSCVASARMLQGKELSFNNIADTDTAVECVRVSSTSRPASSSSTPTPAAWPPRYRWRDAYERAYRTDPTSAFGGIIAFNRELDEATADGDHGPAVRRSDRGAVGVAPTRPQVLAGKQNVRVLVARPARERAPSRARIPQRRRRPARAEPRHRAGRSPIRSRS